jgi:hypothetical protein
MSLTAVGVFSFSLIDRLPIHCLKVKGPRELTFQRSDGEVKTLGP